MPTIQEVFGDSLKADPAIALSAINLPIHRRTGPSPRLQFVIEFVGPRSVSAGLAASLLSSEWTSALGNPTSFAMSSADVEWRPLTAATAGSYDSLAIAWDLRGKQGQLSAATANHLLATAEQFAQHIQRRAMAMPVPEDIPKAISNLKQIEDNFDAGVSVLVLPNSREVDEFSLWVWCARLGLSPNLAEGSFDWIVPSSPHPLFSVTPVGDSESFELESAARQDKHEGILLGFSIPRSPDPVAGFDGMMRAASVLAEKMWGKIYDEDSRPLSDKTKTTMRGQIGEAAAALTKAGFPPGSADALALFDQP